MPLIIAKLYQHRFGIIYYVIETNSRFGIWLVSDISRRELILAMNNKLNEHTGDFIKRQAKRIKKQEGITYLQALEKAAINAGFNNWKHFAKINKHSSVSNSKRAENNLKPNLFQPKITNSQKLINPYRNLLILAINTLIDKHLISLFGQSSDNENGHIFIELFGYPSVILWQNIGFDELRISVWWKYNHELHPQANLTGYTRENFNGSRPLANRIHYKKFVGVVASGWLERDTGKFLQGKNNESIFGVYTRKGEREELERQLPQKPKGFESEGQVCNQD